MPQKEVSSPLTAEQQKELEARLNKAASENRISCASAFAIAKSLSIPPGEVGKAADRLNIRISNCQLGCF